VCIVRPGLAILEHTFDLADEVVCASLVENPYYQRSCGEEFFRRTLPLKRCKAGQFAIHAEALSGNP
jgi:hypothetical protein